jgi:tyrosinase
MSEVLVRKEISGLADDDPIVTEYAAAVERMKGRKADDPLSWSYQANIHGTVSEQEVNLWRQCQHGTWYFLPWHRMYLYYFERIVRAAVVENGGSADWTLPYWNYCLGGQQAFLPEPFRDEGSPLYVDSRDSRLNRGESGLPVTVTSPVKALARPHFTGKAEFGGPATGFEHSGENFGKLENEPHNVVHVAVKGLMLSPETAAQDPIFWLHHANIDRLWSEWIGLKGKHHEDPTDADWLKFEFHFYDEKRQEVTMRPEEVLATAAQLGYTYDTEPVPPPTPPPPPAPAAPRAAAMTTPPPREMVGATSDGLTLTGQQTTVPVPIGDHAAEAFGEHTHVYLNVEEIAGEKNPGVSYLVYADLEGGEPPHPESPHYLGTLSFFGIERARNPVGDEQPHSLGASYDITPIARELEASGKWAGHELPVTFAPLDLVGPDAGQASGVAPNPHDDSPIHLGRLSVFYDA